MGFIIFEPAILASLLATAPSARFVEAGAPTPASSTSSCSGSAPVTAGLDCCLHITVWGRPATTQATHNPAQSQVAAAEQQEGR